MATVAAIAKFQSSFPAPETAVSGSSGNGEEEGEEEKKSIARRLAESGKFPAPEVPEVPEAGRLSPEWLAAMYGRLQRLVLRLTEKKEEEEREKKEAVNDLVLESGRVAALVKSAQEKKGLYASGALDEHTLALL